MTVEAGPDGYSINLAAILDKVKSAEELPSISGFLQIYSEPATQFLLSRGALNENNLSNVVRLMAAGTYNFDLASPEDRPKIQAEFEEQLLGALLNHL